MTETKATRLSLFVDALNGEIDRTGHNEELFLRKAATLLGDLVAHDDWLSDEFCAPHPDRYQQYLLFRDPGERFSIVSFVWGPGQQTPIHDHTIWGMVGMLRGAEMSQRFELRDNKPVAGIEEVLNPGEVLTFSPLTGDIHRVRNAFSDRVSVSIHVYGGDIGKIQRHIYDEMGAMKIFMSGYSSDASIDSSMEVIVE